MSVIRCGGVSGGGRGCSGASGEGGEEPAPEEREGMNVEQLVS